MSNRFDKDSFPKAIRSLLSLNNYDVEESIDIHGAEVDLVARHRSDPFAIPIYIEATIEYVDNNKYGRDVGKLAMIREIAPDAQRIIVSAQGFSNPVRERATASRIRLLTYDELFARFEKFDPYIQACLEQSAIALDLRRLDAIYEEPYFEDDQGKEVATTYLNNWRKANQKDDSWLIITGEYGTGKTALTKVLQYRWLKDYKRNPSLPIPFRIELREFSRQFDGRGLLHHFLDTNALGHIPVDFVYSLLRAGRVVLLLDGYDEMAQYLHARERRACLSALAELSAGGAKGLLTSRPNYFTESEEFHVFEILYSTLDQQKYYLSKTDHDLLAKESQIDEMLTRFLDHHERVLRDLTPEQTESLVQRSLGSDPHGADVVMRILNRIFRNVEKGETVALSGKPVIISYLLEVVEGLKDSPPGKDSTHEVLSEWDVYKMIIDQLMLRDLRRSPEVGPEDRRNFLSKLGIKLSQKESAVITEADFKDLVAKEFQRELRRQPSEQRHHVIERYFADLRGSATLTRSRDPDRPGWIFSHNSLREFLVAEYFVQQVEAGREVKDHVPISDAMRLFVASRSLDDSDRLLRNLQVAWKSRFGQEVWMGQLLTLAWDAMLALFPAEVDSARTCLERLCGGVIDLARLEVDRLTLSTSDHPTSFRSASFNASTLLSVSFAGADVTGADFSDALLDGVTFAEANLESADFRRAFIVEVDLSGANLGGADFSGIDGNDISILVDSVEGDGRRIHLEGESALGYLKFSGARTETVPSYFELRHHPKFAIVEKIVEKLGENSIRQRRGLEQRGAARQDIDFARKFVQHLLHEGLIMTQKNRKDIVEVTETGRDVFGKFLERRGLPEQIEVFLRGAGW